MSLRSVRAVSSRAAALLLLVALAVMAAGCATPDAGSGTGGDKPAENPAPTEDKAEKPEEPKYSSWEVYINDHDTHMKGGVTYKVTLNLTATNPTPTKAGTYSGEAVAQTTTEGTVNGLPLKASAIANSGQLEFTLEAGGGTDDDPLAALTEDSTSYSGGGTISMDAAGSGTIGAAGGSFGKSSSEAVTVKATGEKCTLSVVLNGQKYTFDGVIRGVQ